MKNIRFFIAFVFLCTALSQESVHAAKNVDTKSGQKFETIEIAPGFKICKKLFLNDLETLEKRIDKTLKDAAEKGKFDLVANILDALTELDPKNEFELLKKNTVHKSMALAVHKKHPLIAVLLISHNYTQTNNLYSEFTAIVTG